MGLELRTVRDEEMGGFLRAVGTGFGMVSPGEDDEYAVHLLPAERCLAVHDDDAVVATAGAFPFRLTVPGGAQVGVAAVTVVTVQPTHRRQGLLRQMMDEQLDDVARRGEPLAALTASEASIYERFGYGIATFTTRWELASEYADTGASADGSVRLVEGDAACEAARAVYDAAAATRTGEIERPAGLVVADLQPRETWRALLHRGAHRAATGARTRSRGTPSTSPGPTASRR